MNAPNVGPLRDLFLAIFERTELVVCLRDLPGGAAVVFSLPGEAASVLSVADAAAEALSRHGLITPHLFAHLREARPNQHALINKTALALTQPGGDTAPGAAVYVRSEARSRADRFGYDPDEGPGMLMQAVLSRWQVPSAVDVDVVRVQLRHHLEHDGRVLEPGRGLRDQGVEPGAHLVLCSEPMLLALASTSGIGLVFRGDDDELLRKRVKARLAAQLYEAAIRGA